MGYHGCHVGNIQMAWLPDITLACQFLIGLEPWMSGSGPGYSSVDDSDAWDHQTASASLHLAAVGSQLWKCTNVGDIFSLSIEINMDVVGKGRKSRKIHVAHKHSAAWQWAVGGGHHLLPCWHVSLRQVTKFWKHTYCAHVCVPCLDHELPLNVTCMKGR